MPPLNGSVAYCVVVRQVAALQTELRDRLCALDLFGAISWLTPLVTANTSCIDAYYRLSSRREPLSALGWGLRCP